MKFFLVVFLLIGLSFCGSEDDRPDIYNPTGAGPENGNNVGNNPPTLGNCNVTYPEWTTSPYVLPYPVGESYVIGLSHCGGSFHSAGGPDQFAIDFNMSIGTIITASRDGKVVHVTESGFDGEFPNNLVVVRHFDNTYAQYMHLTKDGAIVTVGETVKQGDTLGYSGATGLAGYPHLHFVVTQDSWPYPYISVPNTFKNTDPNPKSLLSGRAYEALPY
ncbi:M23 family metallopeptidase [Marinirhabdus gelatinilytica]|uniref:Peptidase M23-like protein n=1 Tax=Marinirhabdus gelatinilytica TaxID=1703343 RepID=A0A370QET5_9FLAO|nr:M23 family metallopeptidase [Marinirhabdus gelatinilytica]RDK86882.1 peptidase M23-like protein [Marinirhabdus gelatinilytica]